MNENAFINAKTTVLSVYHQDVTTYCARRDYWLYQH